VGQFENSRPRGGARPACGRYRLISCACGTPSDRPSSRRR
jgi:hypothetical protein